MVMSLLKVYGFVDTVLSRWLLNLQVQVFVVVVKQMAKFGIVLTVCCTASECTEKSAGEIFVRFI